MGANVGYSVVNSQFSSSSPASSISTGALSTSDLDAFKGTGSYAIGLAAGFNYALPSRLVAGFEADISFPSTIEGNATLPSVRPLSMLNEAVQTSGTVRARFGYAPGAWLFYATGGLAWTKNQVTLEPLAASDGEIHDLTRLGYAWGAGAEFGLTPNWSAKFEYLDTRFGSQAATFSRGAQQVTSDWTVHTARLGFNYRLGGDDRQLLSEGVKPLETDWFSLRGQTTYL